MLMRMMNKEATGCIKLDGRKNYIDALRGIAMIAVVLQHANNPGSPSLTKLLLSFHMPLFFFISGMLMSGRNFRNKQVAEYLKGLLFTIVIPLITYMLIQDTTEILISKSIPTPDILLAPLKNWFLVTLLLMKLISYGKYRVTNGRQSLVIVCLIIEVIVFCICDYTEIKYVQTTLCALVFGDIGYLLCPYIEKMYFQVRISGCSRVFEKIAAGGVFALFITVTIILCAYNESVLVYINQYGSKPYFIFVAFLGITACIDLVFAFENNELLLLIGRNTLIIYITHFAVYRLLREVFWPRFVGTISSEGIFPNYWILFLVAMAVQFPIIYIANRFLPVMFGKAGKQRPQKK